MTKQEIQDKILLDQVVSGIPYTFVREMLVKPLEDVYITREVERPKKTGELDESGYEITENVKEEVTEITNFKEGIVLKESGSYNWVDGKGNPLAEEFIPRVGDTVVYSRRQCVYFDLFKDSELVNPYNVVAVIKK